MTNPLATQLRAIAAQLDAGTGVAVTSRVLAETGDPSKIPWNTDGVAMADWWVKGYLGCMKGAHNKHYSEAHVVMGLLAGDIPRHMSIIQPVPATLPWASALISAADCGWIDGTGYNPTPVAGAYQRWIDAGCPSKNGTAAYDVRGQPIRAGAWQEVYDRMATARGGGTAPPSTGGGDVPIGKE